MTLAHDREVPTWLDGAAYPFEHHWVEIEPGRRLHYIDEGRGSPILFVHGTPTWSFEWRHLIGALSDSHRCVAPDLLGMGLSDRPADAEYSPEAHAERVARFVRALDLKDFVLVVHDFGGPIALPLALSGSGLVSRLVVINSWMWSFQDDRKMARLGRLAGSGLFRLLYRWANASLRVIMPSAYGDRRRLTPAIHAQYLSVFPDRDSRERVLWAFARALLGSSSHYQALWERREALRALPALVVWGTRDSALQPHLLERWRTALPDAQVVELPVGHWPHEEDPEATAEAVRAFLSKLRS